MSRKSMYALCGRGDGGITQALATRTLELLRSGPAPPPLLAAMLAALAHLLDAAIANTNANSHNRYVTCCRINRFVRIDELECDFGFC